MTAIFLACAGALAQGEVVGEIVVKGLTNISETTVLSTMRTKVGQIYQETQLAKDKSSLEALGVFQDVKVFGQLLEDKKWRVVVEVVEWPVIQSIDVSGNTVFDDAKILDTF
ncbi:MAG TPA: POTRA domain-containing protein, partial [Fimbriimonadales bacterium]|nr:POTRA domain-containing protein [Fimbriimonadales bacterium]